MSLRKHMREMHHNLRLPRSNADLLKLHRREHHHFATNHIHNPGWPNTGPDNRPPGWTTGEDAVPREPNVNARLNKEN